MPRDGALARITDHFESGSFFDDLARRVAIPTESQEHDRRPDLHRYLDGEMTDSFDRLGFSCRTYPNPLGSDEPPFLVAHRHE